MTVLGINKIITFLFLLSMKSTNPLNFVHRTQKSIHISWNCSNLDLELI